MNRLTPSPARMAAFALLAASALPSIRPSPAAAQQTNHEMQFYVLGKKHPRGLSDFQAFGLFRSGRNGKVRLEGWAMANRSNPTGSTVDMAYVRQTGKRLIFATKPRNGRTFTFSGTFLRSGDFTPYLNKQIPVVEGTVRKFRNGRKVAEGMMRFTCGAGG